MRRNDYLLAGAICLSAMIFWLLQIAVSNPGTTVAVKVDGDMYGTYFLNRDQEISIDGKNLLVIEDHKAYMKWADCKDQLCVRQGAISGENESIICLPNKVIVEISRQGYVPEIDAVAQ